MGQTEIRLVLTVIGILVLVFIAGIVLFLFQYRQRQLIHEREKKQINEKHELDLLNTQIESQRQTMQHIGQEIHDSVAQKLTLASIYTQRMEFETEIPVEKDKFKSVSKIINDSLLELRQLSQNLTDAKLQNASLQELVQLECEQVNATGVCAASCKANNLPEIAIPMKSSLIRIVQEFIQNSLKHSGCREINIILRAEVDELFLYMEDDGKGFDRDAIPGVGLDSIRRRTAALRGKYNFENKSGKGVRLKLTTPLRNFNKPAI